MKKIFLLLAVALLTISAANAQKINKGDFLIGARATGVDFTFGSGTDIGLDALGGYFIMDKLAVGGIFNLGHTSPKGGGDSSTDVGLLAGARYYPMELSNGALFGGGYMGILKSGNADTSFAIALEGGYAYFIKENIAIEPALTILIPFAKGADATFNIGVGFTLYF